MPASSTGPVPQIKWRGQTVRRGRDQDPHGSKRPCIQGLTRTACFDMVLVVTRGEKRCHTDCSSAVHRGAGSLVPSLGRELDHIYVLPCWGLDAKPLRLLPMNAGYPVVSKTFSSFLKKKQTKTGHVGTGLGSIKLLDCQCFGCI